jgi:hypothetical protein
VIIDVKKLFLGLFVLMMLFNPVFSTDGDIWFFHLGQNYSFPANWSKVISCGEE